MEDEKALNLPVANFQDLAKVLASLEIDVKADGGKTHHEMHMTNSTVLSGSRKVMT